MKLIVGLLYLVSVVGGVASIFAKSWIVGLVLTLPVAWIMLRKPPD